MATVTGHWHPKATLTNHPSYGLEWTLDAVSLNFAVPPGSPTWGRAVREYVGGSAIRAMEVVYGYLLTGGEDGCFHAQTAVLAIEDGGSLLPSSVFERVAREAAKREETTQVYTNFILRAYGTAAGAKVLGSAVAS